jgi:hypothetical protein
VHPGREPEVERHQLNYVRMFLGGEVSDGGGKIGSQCYVGPVPAIDYDDILHLG